MDEIQRHRDVTRVCNGEIDTSCATLSTTEAKQTGVFVTLEGSLEQTRAMWSTTKPFKEALRSTGLQRTV